MAAIRTRKPQLVCLSVTHLEQPRAFVAGYNDELVRPTRPYVKHAIGGGALAQLAGEELLADLCATRLADLAAYLPTIAETVTVSP